MLDRTCSLGGIVLWFGLLGDVEVLDAGKPVSLPSLKQRLVLTVLLLRVNRVVRNDVLADALWNEVLPADPAAALRSQVTRLRRALGPHVDLTTEAHGYRLRVDRDHLDIARFEDLLDEAEELNGEAALALLDQALELRRGPLEFGDHPFVQPEAARLDELYLLARERHAQESLVGGDVGTALAAMQALLTEHPERERTRALLIEALYRAGRHTQALDIYEAWRRLLAEQGLDPSPELQQLHLEVLRHQVGRGRGAGTSPSLARLPLPRTSFVGRERDLAAVGDLIGSCRLVTLIGFGGVGKTRLALELASLLAERYVQGVRLCDLSAVRRPGVVVRAVATAVGLEERALRRLDDQLVEHLAGSRLLLVLDNCEHVLDAVAPLCERLLGETGDVDVLVTTRERLGVTGEYLWEVRPLAANDVDASAVRLFLDRARAVVPSLVDTLDVPAVQELCARLDGLPLAIELAAARLTGLTVSEIATSLDGRLDPPGGGRGRGRHQSLRSVMDWSIGLLSPAERRVFERLCVFAGQFDLAAAVAINDEPEPDVTEIVLRLVDRSLLTAAQHGVTTNYGLLDTVRRYGLERLAEDGGLDTARDRHAEWALELTRQAELGLSGPAEATWVTVIDRHFADLRAAHSWLVGRDVRRGLELVFRLHWYALWRQRSEVFRWAEVAAAAAGGVGAASDLLAAVQASAAMGAVWRGDVVAAQETASGAARLAATSRGGVACRRAREALGEVALLQGDLDRAVELYGTAASEAIAQDAGAGAAWALGSVSLAHAWGNRSSLALGAAEQAHRTASGSGCPSAIAFVDYVYGELWADSRPDAARRHLNRAMELAATVDSRLIVGLARVSLATLVSRHERDPRIALQHYDKAIREWQQTGAWTSQWVTLRTLVELLTRLGRTDDAAVLLGAVSSANTGAAPFGADEQRLRAATEALRAELGSLRFDRLAQRGAALSDKDAVAFALESIRRARAERRSVCR